MLCREVRTSDLKYYSWDRMRRLFMFCKYLVCDQILFDRIECSLIECCTRNPSFAYNMLLCNACGFEKMKNQLQQELNRDKELVLDVKRSPLFEKFGPAQKKMLDIAREYRRNRRRNGLAQVDALQRREEVEETEEEMQNDGGDEVMEEDNTEEERESTVDARPDISPTRSNAVDNDLNGPVQDETEEPRESLKRKKEMEELREDEEIKKMKLSRNEWIREEEDEDEGGN
ncbi:hypothetical protein PFISCL1PPCAC_1450 [Pristionchus fissidentatus]|uniref:Uncharacterized protein n=1 Tax=Pristionchus fissidentatus TaxID=1538716 RepID=A0AAV5UVH8_9BILA|nr:hypothetical protein PFISCL1PPCAC_1450 [Pristionchus fissidentatus]